MALLEALGIPVPRRLEVQGAADLARLEWPPLPGERLVIKAVAPAILHKTEVGGVAIAPNRRDAALAALAAMERRLAGGPVDGYLLAEFVPHEPALGHELLASIRWTDDFGPVVSVGAGGIATEALAAAFADGEGLAVVTPGFPAEADLPAALQRVAAVRLVTAALRGRPPAAPVAVLADLVRRLLALSALMPAPLAELEVNPFALAGGRWVALDALVKLREAAPATPPARPLEKLARLLAPRSIAVMGVSEKGLNPGRIILRNLLRERFPAERLFVIKPGLDTLDGCRCVGSLEALPEPVDLLVLAISAAQAPEAITAVVEGRRAESVILIPGGLDERPESAPLVARMKDALERSRASDWRGPVVNGGNCLGVTSVPGRVDTLFIPAHKRPVWRGGVRPLALVSGSGAFVVARDSQLAGLRPRYAISIGNQMDLTIGDYLTVLADDPEVRVAAVYAEGFRPLDGRAFLAAARRFADSGRTVILYRAGRSAAGARAAASHTASIAGDSLVTRRLAEAAGVLVADTLQDFDDLVRLCVLLDGREPAGDRLGAISNAGFECVAIAYRLGPFALAAWAEETRAAIARVLEEARLAEIVALHNPIDLTPILADAGYAEVARAVLADPGVDLGLVGCVPLTGALQTLARGEGHAEDVGGPDSLASRLVRLNAATRKPWVAVVDGGPLYDAMARVLEDGGVPTFRTADRALAMLARWWRGRAGARARG